MAGIKAARDLVAAGASVIVLEGRARVGGRTHTVELAGKAGNIKVDLGASWIHGLTGNPLVALAGQAGVALAKQPTDYENSVLYLPDGREASDAQWLKWEATFSEFEEYVSELQARDDPLGRDPGLGAAARQFIQGKRLTGLDRQAFLFEVNTFVEQEYAASVANLSLFFNYDSGLGDGDKLVTGGYQNLVKWLARGIDVRLGHKVIAIDSSRPDRIAVAVAGRGTFTARRVVVAVPLGVMQAGSIRFKPSGLPAANRRALGMLGSGMLNKVVLVFDRVFWDADVEAINRIAPAGNGAFQETLNLFPVTGQPVLVAFNAANYARHLEKKSAKQVKDEFLAVLRSLYDDVPEPRSYKVTAWGRDEFSLGSYSYTKAPVAGEEGFIRAHRDTAKPMAGNRIFFAGEHTSVNEPATVHGAYWSGQQAARDVIANE